MGSQEKQESGHGKFLPGLRLAESIARQLLRVQSKGADAEPSRGLLGTGAEPDWVRN